MQVREISEPDLVFSGWLARDISVLYSGIVLGASFP